MVAEGNKAIVRRFVEEVQNGGNLAVLDEFAAPDYVNHSAPPGVQADREGIKQLTAMFRQAFPDGQMTIEDMVAEEDRVATRKTFRGTHHHPTSYQYGGCEGYHQLSASVRLSPAVDTQAGAWWGRAGRGAV